MKDFDNNRRNFFKHTGKGVGIALGATIASNIPFNNYASAAEKDNPNQSSKIDYPFTLRDASRMTRCQMELFYGQDLLQIH